MAFHSLIWDDSRTAALNWLGMRAKLIDRAVLSGRISSLDQFGVSYDLMSVADFTLFAGHAPRIRPPMEPAVGTGAHLINWQNNSSMYILQ